MSQDSSHLQGLEAGTPAPIYLITGEEFLVRKVSEELVQKLLPKAMAGLNLSILEGTSPSEVVRDLATAPMFRGRKVVVVREPEFLAPRKGRQDALSKVKEAWNAGRRRVAANRALALLARAGLGLQQLQSPDPEAFARELEIELAEADIAFLKDLGLFCQAENLNAPEGDTRALEAFIEKGLPKDHILIVEAVHFDGRTSLAKLLMDRGEVVERHVEKELRKLDIHDLVGEVLRPLKKRLDAGGEKLLKDLCGGNMRLLQSELEKLALFVGEKPIIEAADVDVLVRRAREEEFRELADALGARDAKSALRYIAVALDQEEPPLKIHGALATLVRRMVEDRERWTRHGFGPRTGQREFESKGLPLLAEELKEKDPKAKVPHPYVAWLGFQACMRFELRELIGAHLAVARADIALKSGGIPRLVLESLVLKICQKAA